MNALTIRTLDATATLAPETLAAFRAKMRGIVALPGEDGYDAARTIWNAMIDRRPAFVARCLAPPTSCGACKLARDENLLVPCAAAATISPATPSATAVC